MFYISYLCVMNKALIGCYTLKLQLDVHVCGSCWLLTHMTIISYLYWLL